MSSGASVGGGHRPASVAFGESRGDRFDREAVALGAQPGDRAVDDAARSPTGAASSSRAAGFERCTSIFTPSNIASASVSAYA